MFFPSLAVGHRSRRVVSKDEPLAHDKGILFGLFSLGMVGTGLTGNIHWPSPPHGVASTAANGFWDACGHFSIYMGVLWLLSLLHYMNMLYLKRSATLVFHTFGNVSRTR
jgi:hypothetical protein